MDEINRRIAMAQQLTQVLRPPKQLLATFGATDLRYYLVSKPSCSDIIPGGKFH
jgi:hypothetical protein